VTCWAVIPAKSSPESKSRLAKVLAAEARSALADAMLAHVVEAVSGATNIAQVCLLGSPRDGEYAGLLRLDDPGGGLNSAVQSALADAARRGADRVIMIHADLPLVTAHDLELLAAVPAGEIGIAADRHGTGTNAISLPIPEAAAFSFAFGPDSFARHNAEAERLGLRVEEIRSPGLAKDVDEPEDLPDAESLLKQVR
jgi:2-phospho-L-lactate guanylyltransferase